SAALVSLVLVRERVPRVTPASAPATEFSGARAWPVVAYLADTIGHRVAGTPGADSAVAYLARRLRAIPGVEVDVQTAEGSHTVGTRTNAYRVTNVIARIRGATPDAVLFSSHYDSPPQSVGAADDAVAVAALLEAARAIAAGPRPRHTLVFLFNDAEEICLCGAHAFTKHPWFTDVRAFANFESAGTDGKMVMFQSGPGNAWLARAYASAVPYPYGTVIGQDIFQAGFIPSDTDFRIYRDAGMLRGLDFALYRGGYAYHTDRDRPWNVRAGSVEHAGANALALARWLGERPLPPATDERAVYYDVLGVTMIEYGASTGRALGLGALAAAAIIIVLVMRRLRIGAARVLTGFLICVAGTVVGVAATAVVGAVPYYLAGRSMGWYAHPAAGIAAFGGAAVTAVLSVHALLARRWSRRSARHIGIAPERSYDVWIGALLLWMLLLLVLTVRGAGSAYLALWPTILGAFGLGVASIGGARRYRAGMAIAAVVPAVLVLQVTSMLLAMFVPVMGRMPLAVAPDVVVAILVALPVSMLSLLALPAAHRAGGLAGAALASAAVALVALVVTVVQFPYTRVRPQRLAIAHVESDSVRRLEMTSLDFNAPLRGAFLTNLHHDAALGRRGLVRDAAPTGLAAPTIVVMVDALDAAAGGRVLTLRAHGGGSLDVLTMPRERVASWSLAAPMPPPAAGTTALRLLYVAPPDSGWVVTLHVRGTAPLPVELASSHFAASADATKLTRALPPWTDAPSRIVRITRATF
ncbi:MAG: M20/M25/M40 family metallo-hydrolase, partial [Gemmatimonadaceae bacterium]